MTRPVVLSGRPGTEPPGRRLAAGPLTAEFVDGGLRNIRLHGHDVLRAIAYVVRDRDWGTYHPTLSQVEVDEGTDGFCLRYTARCTAPDGAVLTFHACIEAAASGRLAFTVDAAPDHAFETNRTGFCVLHPIEGIAGTTVRVTHGDGSIEDGVFPDRIAPWQPFKDIRALSHAPAPGLWADCRLEGDSFEMEDQRAWSDASYKTYVRPLSLPWPYTLAAGQTIRQRVLLEVRATAAATPRTTPKDVSISLGDVTDRAMPALGIALSPEDRADGDRARDALHRLAPQWLTLHFEPGIGHGPAELDDLRRLADAVPAAGRMIEFVVPTKGNLAEAFDAAAAAIHGSGLAPDAIAILADVDRQSTPPGSAWPPCPPLETLYAQARRVFPGIAIGGGMFSYFTELNRKRVPADLLDFVTHATCPIVHAADDESVMQTLEAVPFITRSTRAFIGATPYRLGPTTIGMRQNPYGSRTMPNPDGRRVAMAADDPRGREQFGAAWLVGYAARLAEADVQCWTAGALAGPRGILLPGGGVAPAFSVLQALARLAGRPRIALASNARGRIDGFAAKAPDGTQTLWLANLTARHETMRLPDGRTHRLAPFATHTVEGI